MLLSTDWFYYDSWALFQFWIDLERFSDFAGVAPTIISNISPASLVASPWCENLRLNAVAKGICAMFISWTTKFSTKSFMVVRVVLTGNYVANDPVKQFSTQIFLKRHIHKTCCCSVENMKPQGIYFHVSLSLFLQSNKSDKRPMVSLSFALFSTFEFYPLGCQNRE